MKSKKKPYQPEARHVRLRTRVVKSKKKYDRRAVKTENRKIISDDTKRKFKGQ